VCFGTQADLLSARPGARLWSADLTTGDVIATLNFQGSLAAAAPKHSLSAAVPRDRALAGWDGYGPDAPAPAAAAVEAFALLHRLPAPLLLAWSEAALYLLDLGTIEVAAWYDGLRDVRMVAVADRAVYVLNDGARRLTCLEVGVSEQTHAEHPSS
jgi:hypothetical protein